MNCDPHLEATCYHEAGHAVVGTILNFPTRRLSVIPTAAHAGQHLLDMPVGHFEPSDIAVWALAGKTAEQWFLRDRDPRLVARAAASDDAFVRTLLDCTCKVGEDVDALGARYALRALTLVITNERWIKAVAERLLRDNVLDDDLVRDLQPA